VFLNLSNKIHRFTFLILLVIVARQDSLIAQSKPPIAFVVQFNDTSSDYQQILGGSPQTASMESGLVVLSPSKSVGKHSTKSYEEAVIILSGTGEIKITGGQTLKLTANCVAYCPPNTEHDVINTGSQPLRYLYIASKHK
jgi:mannose-6-phosphate isomerase-like protein (cupin superfamily)